MFSSFGWEGVRFMVDNHHIWFSSMDL